MNLRPLGNTGLQVSEISLGTAEIGLDYGFKGAAGYRRPDIKDSIRLIHKALDLGVNLIDTARAYGNSEEVIGQALRETSKKPLVVSKVYLSAEAVHSGTPSLRRAIFASVEASLKALRRETIDVLLIHNSTLNLLRRPEIPACLDKVRRQGKVRFLGASCYGEETSLKALDIPLLRALQIPFSLLDQKMSQQVFPRANRQGVGALVRSAYLRGVLTNRVHRIPERLARLRERALKAVDLLQAEANSLSEIALRFCLSFPQVSSVIIGVKTVQELESNLEDARAGAFSAGVIAKLKQFSFRDDPLVDIREWKDLI
jgi:1-deoxyxylulose-5-phosphate synthase